MNHFRTGLGPHHLEERSQVAARLPRTVLIVLVLHYPAARRPAVENRRAVEPQVVNDLGRPIGRGIEADIEAVHKDKSLLVEPFGRAHYPAQTRRKIGLILKLDFLDGEVLRGVLVLSAQK